MFKEGQRARFKMMVAVLLVLGQLAMAFFVFSPGQLASKQLSARAASSEDMTIYLPNINNNFPTRNIFGASYTVKTSTGSDLMADAGTGWVRNFGLNWYEVEPAQGQYNWSVLDSYKAQIARAHADGVRPIVILQGTPSWAQKYSGIACGPMTSDTIGDFSKFVYEVVRTLSVEPYGVKDFEFWNEPEIPYNLMASNPTSFFGCWGDRDLPYYGGSYYADVLKTIYPWVKLANPSARVLVGGLMLDCDPRKNNCPHEKFFEGVLANDGGDYFDGVSFHAYDIFFYNSDDPASSTYAWPNWDSTAATTGPSSLAKASYIRDLLDQYGVEGKFLINTESALVCGGMNDTPGGTGCESNSDSYYEQMKAKYVVHTYVSAFVDGLAGNVWYAALGWRNSNLINSNLTTRPAYTAYKVTARELKDVTFKRSLDLGETVTGYEFTRGNQTIWVVWAMGSTTASVDLGSAPTKIITGLDEAVTLASTIQVTDMPVFITWQN